MESKKGKEMSDKNIQKFISIVKRYNHLYNIKLPSVILAEEWKRVKYYKRLIPRKEWMNVPSCVRHCYANHALIIQIFKPFKRSTG